MFLIDLQYNTSLDVVDKHVVAHRAWLDELFAQNKLLCCGPKHPRTGGVIVCLLDDRTALDELLKEDPYQQNGVANYTITEFKPYKFHSVFEPPLN